MAVCDPSNTYAHIMEKTNLEALMRNNESTRRWEKYKQDYIELVQRLPTFSKELKHPIMVPIGSKALMKGSLVHTNEILISLGEGWFIKDSAERAVAICNRRIAKCEEVLKQYQREYKFLESQREFGGRFNVFESDDTQEIVEKYNDEEEKQWREKHRVKERQYRQQLASSRKETEERNTSIITEEDLWKRLDALDLQEELEDELNRMSGDDDLDSDDEDSDNTEEDSDSEIPGLQETIVNKPVEVKSKKKVSFDMGTNSDSDAEQIRIEFKHSPSTDPKVNNFEKGLVSPSDVYKMFPGALVSRGDSQLKGCLKPSVVKEAAVDDSEKGLDSPSSDYKMFPDALMSKVNSSEVKESELNSTPMAFGDIVERTTEETTVQTSNRPMSKFKAARQSGKK